MRPGFLVLLLLVAAFASSAAQSELYDVIIRNGRVLDGSGNPYFYADVGVRGDLIVAVGDLSRARARRVVDAAGQYVTPGFIALHEHVEPAILGGYGTLPNYTTQGFTTAVIDADGRTAIWPIARQRVELERAGSALNLVMMVGHGTVRSIAMLGPEVPPSQWYEWHEEIARPATGEEIERMKMLVRQGMEEGAFGLSTGLEYLPMRYSTEEEVRELAKAVAPYGGHYQAHMRSQGRYPKWQLPSTATRTITWMDAVMETIEIARAAGIPVMMDHIHPKGPREWGMSKVTTQLIDRAWNEGLEVYINMHSYEGYETAVTLIPQWALVKGSVRDLPQSDGRDPRADYSDMNNQLERRLADPELARVIRADIEYEILRQGGPENLLIVDFPDRSLIGKTLADVAALRRESPVDAAIWLQYNGLPEPGGVLWMAKAVSLLDIEEWMRQPYTGVCLDRGGDTPRMREQKSTHPGSFGTSGRLIREFVFQRGTITLPHAIRQLTSVGAQVLGLKDRGRIAEGMKADLVVFDPARIKTEATYLNPWVYQEGMTYVLVNGRFVVDGGRPTEATPGRVLERQRRATRSPRASANGR